VAQLIGWSLTGLLVGALAWRFSPERPGIGLPVAVVLGMLGAIFGGLGSWVLWDFPAEPYSVHEVLTTDSVMSYPLAVLGAMLVLTLGWRSARRRA
jgi:uncharacterized membrane protein YeaQ/YmgE (transglycosylase-associated protein family)